MRIAAALALCASLACGKNSVGAPDAGSALVVSAAAGLDVFQAPSASEGSGVQGMVQVTMPSAMGEVPVSGASVTLNGVALPEGALPGHYDADQAALAQVVVPGASLNLLAISGGQTASVSFACPAAVSFTAPVESAMVRAGAALEVEWVGRIAYNPVLAPSLFFRSYDAATNGLGAPYLDPTANVKLAETATSAQLTVPSDGKAGYAVELLVPGVFANQASTGGSAVCILHRRVHLKTSP